MPETETTDICPYCGAGVDPNAAQCRACTGRLDELNQRVTQQHMGPWYVRQPHMAFRPGFSYSVMKDMVRRGVVEADTIIRGPTTRQYWRYAKDVPGVAHLLGVCHACGQWVEATAKVCPHCSREFPSPEHRNYLGLDPDNFKLLRDVAQRERAVRERQQQPQPQPQGSQAETQAAGDPSSSRQAKQQPTAQRQQAPAAETGGGGSASGSALGAGDLSELAEIASERGKYVPRTTVVPRRAPKRTSNILWAMLGISIVLFILIIVLLVVYILRDDGTQPAEGEESTATPVQVEQVVVEAWGNTGGQATIGMGEMRDRGPGRVDSWPMDYHA